MPTVSVILPTFNRTRFLAPAIASVFAQTCPDWELIVADDGSTEETRDYLRSLTDSRVRTIWLTHSGNPSHVRNAAIAAAEGRYLAFLDSDDLWAPTKLEKQIAALGGHAGCRWSYTACERIDENGLAIVDERLRAIAARDGWVFEPLLKLQIVIPMPAVVAERGLVDDLGGFDEQQRFGEFQDLCLRLAMSSEVVAVREPLCSIRAHGEHYSGDRIAAHEGWMRLYGKMARLTSDPGLRSHCLRMRGETALNLASLQGDRGDRRAAWGTLRSAATSSWRYPMWWVGALKAVVRPAVPKVLRSTLRR